MKMRQESLEKRRFIPWQLHIISSKAAAVVEMQSHFILWSMCQRDLVPTSLISNTGNDDNCSKCYFLFRRRLMGFAYWKSIKRLHLQLPAILSFSERFSARKRKCKRF